MADTGGFDEGGGHIRRALGGVGVLARARSVSPRVARLTAAAVAGVAIGGPVVASAIEPTTVNEPPRAGRELTAFPSRDFVSVSGYAADQTVTIEIIHASGVKRSTASGLVPQDDPSTPAFDGIVEVNHPGGACWQEVTPDIVPGDKLRVTVDSGPGAGIADQTTVANVTAGRPVHSGPGTITVRGTAQDKDGAPLPLAQIEQRLVAAGDLFALSGKRTLRAPGNGTLTYDAAGSTEWTASYTGLNASDIDKALGAESRGMWLGADPAAGNELTIHENGAGVVGGPQSPCTAPKEVLPPPPGSETVPPSRPAGLKATVSDNSTVTLDWSASTDNVGVTSYGVYRDGVAIWNVQRPDGSAPAPTTFRETNLPPGTYTYTVDAQDAIGNRSEQSASTTATATAKPAAPAVEANEPPVNKEIVAFPSRDFVEVAGYAGDELARIEVIRNGNVISDASGLIPQDDPSTAAFDGVVEVNHPGGGCWAGTTPEIRAGDVVRSTAYGPEGAVRAVDQTRVANVVARKAVQTATGTVEVYGSAADANGDPIDIGQVEQRLISGSDNRFQKNGRRALLAPGDGTLSYDTRDNPTGTKWTARYTGLSQADVDRALSVESRILWLGSQPLAGVELTIFEVGGEDPPGPAPGFCTAPLEPADERPPSTPVLSAENPTGSKDVKLDWSAATDDHYVYGYRVLKDGKPLKDVSGRTTTFTDKNVVGEHAYAVAAFDSASPRGPGANIVEKLHNGQGQPYGNLSTPSVAKTIGVADLSAPSTPQNLTAKASGETVALTWTPSQDDVGVSEYRVYRRTAGTAEWGAARTTTTASFTDEAVGAGDYDYTVDAVDAKGNVSDKAVPVRVNVVGTADIVAPSVPAAVTATTQPDIDGRDVRVTWAAASDEGGVSGYGLYRNGTKVADVSGGSLSYTDAGRPAGTYVYKVDAVDSAGNRSAQSSGATAVVANNPPQPGHELIAFPQRDFVAASGYASGNYVVDVFRGGRRVSGSAPTAAQDDPATPDFDGIVEVNHGGDGCWTGTTPDIRAGDVVRITGPDGIAEQVRTADVTAGRPIQVAADTVVVKGTAADGAGNPIDLGQLEQRLISSGDNFAINGRRALLSPGDGTLAYDAAGSNRWTATYRGLSAADVTRALAAESRVLWLGRSPLVGNELTIHENGSGVAGGPATPDCSAPLEASAPRASHTPASLAFGKVALSTTSGTRTVTLSNPGTVPLTIRSVYLAGANFPETFRINGNTCGASLPAGANCTVGVTFSPGAQQATRTASLNFATSAANDGFQSIALSGEGADEAAPTVTGLRHTVAQGGSVTPHSTIANSALPVNLAWTGANASRYELEYNRGGTTTWVPVTLASPTATTATANLAMGTLAAQPTYQFRVRAGKVNPDGTTTWSAYATTVRFTLTPIDQTLTNNISYGGTWTTENSIGAYGGSVRHASTSGTKAKLNRLTFNTAGNVAWIGTMGPNMGRAAVRVDSGAEVTVDLYSPTVKKAHLVWVRNDMSASGAQHQVEIRVLGTRNASSTGTRVDLDGFVALR